MSSLIEALKEKGYNTEIEGLIIKSKDHPRYIDVIKYFRNAEGIDIPMSIMLCINDWGGVKEYDFLKLDDFFIISLTNGTQEQGALDVTGRRKGNGEMTDFIKQFVGGNKFYVRGTSPYWNNTFNCKGMSRGIISCTNPDNTTGGGKRNKKSKRRKSKKRKSKTRRRSR